MGDGIQSICVSRHEKRASLDADLNIHNVPRQPMLRTASNSASVRHSSYLHLVVRPFTKPATLFCLFSNATIILAVLVVCFTIRPRSVPNCSLHFTAMSPNPIEYNYDPRSVVLADFDNNTWLDIAVVNRAADSIKIFFRHGDDVVGSVVTYSTGGASAPLMLAVTDLNDDHQPDIVTANFGSNSLGLFLGLGNGSFDRQVVLSTDTSRPVWIIAVDLNDDSRIDLVAANSGVYGVMVFYGYGNGSFIPALAYSTGYDSRPVAVAAGDINNDGRIDLIIVNHGTSNIVLLLANGDGTFADAIFFSTGANSHPCSIVVGHFDDDSLLDVAVGINATNSILPLFSYVNSTFSNASVHSIGDASPSFIAVADMNGDQRMDLVASTRGAHNLVVLLGDSKQRFLDAQMILTGSFSSTSLAIGDLNKDARLDVVVVSEDTGLIDVLLGSYEGFRAPQTYRAGWFPYAIAVGDFNHDKHLDVVVVNNDDNDLSVFIGHGDGTFANQTRYNTGSLPQAVAIGDLNNDSHLDMAVVGGFSGRLAVFLGYGNGSFRQPMNFRVGDSPVSVVVGDFNEDGNLDFITGNGGSADVSILLGFGNGSFSAQLRFTIGARLLRYIVVGDFNNDRRADIAIASENADFDGVSVLIGLGNGSFDDPTRYKSGDQPESLAVADFDNNGRLDLVVANYRSNDVSVLLGNGGGSFNDQTTFAAGAFPQAVATGDFDNDTYPDIAVANLDSGDVSILLGLGNGFFARQTRYAAGDSPRAIAVGDFNGDARLDIATVSIYGFKLNILLQNNRAALIPAASFTSANGSRLQSVVAADVNADNQTDIVVANYGTSTIDVLVGDGNGSFTVRTTLDTGAHAHPSAMVGEDFNGDGLMDLAVANYDTRQVLLMLGDGHGMFFIQKNDAMRLLARPLIIAAGDFDKDGRAELIAAYNDIDQFDIFTASSRGSFTDQHFFRVGSSPRSMVVGDFNNDNRLDLAVVNQVSNDVSILLGLGNGTFATEMRYQVGMNPQCIAMGDFNNDSTLDLAIVSAWTTGVSVLLNCGNGSFANQTWCPTDFAAVFIATADFDKNGQLDLVVVDNRGYAINILLGEGNGSFTNQTKYETGLYPWTVALADFNHDSHLDIVVANTGDKSPYVSLYFGYGNGSFTEQVKYSLDMSLDFLAVADFDNDNRYDMVIVHLNEHAFSIHLGQDNGTFVQRTIYSLDFDPQFVAVADFDQDTRLDLIVTALYSSDLWVFLGFGNGLFTSAMKYAAGAAPLWIAIGDFNNDKRPDVVATNSDSSDVSVLLGYRNEVFESKTTLVGRNSSRPQAFAIADLNGDTHTDIVVAYSEIDQIGIFLGHGNMSFAEEITYSTGPLSSPQSLAVADFNNDTRPDIAVAHYATDSIGIFLGHGNGSFAEQQTYSTGVGSAPRAIVVADFNNDLIVDVLVANEDTSEFGVFLGRADGVFSSGQFFPLAYGSRPFLVVAAYFNGDRKVDVAVANAGTDNLNVFLQTC